MRYQFHNDSGADAAGGPQGFAQKAHRGRRGCSRAGSESPLEPVRADARDDEADAESGIGTDDAGDEGVYTLSFSAAATIGFAQSGVRDRSAGPRIFPCSMR